MLAMDRNNNATIDSGAELFGDQHGAANGFEELARFDDDRNGTIDTHDAVYRSLKMWQDVNQNGVSEAHELQSLEDIGIASINLRPDSRTDSVAGNRVQGYSTYSGNDRGGRVGEVFLNYLA
jgi:hypothetical protein